ncbi:MAG: hypothetical protein K2X03_09035 [Bryobacteraceae bacterium]|nr:hypothetical protein [Bryobacteraceae bacterium]
MLGIGLSYLMAYVAWLASGANPASPIGDPFLAVMEALTLVSAPLFVAMIAAIHQVAAEDKKVFGVIALAFATAGAAITMSVHFVQLTAVRQLGGDGTLRWPGIAYALDQLAWDLLFGGSLIAAACTFGEDRFARLMRGSLLVTGSLCWLGGLGPVLGDMRIQRMGILGYAVVLPAVCRLLAVYFRRLGPGAALNAQGKAATGEG